MDIGIFWGLLSSLVFAFCYISLKKSYEEFKPSVAFFFDSLFGILIWIPFSLVLGVSMTNILNITIWAFVSAILSEAYFFFVLSKGEVSITGTLLASYPIYTALFSRFINNESLNLLQFLAISITIIGTLIVSTEGKIKIKDLKKRDYVFWALSGAIAVGLSDSLSKRAIDQVSMQDFLVALAVVQLPISLVYLKLEKQSFKEIIKSVKKLEKYRFAILGSVLNVVGVLFLWLSFENTLASIASPLTATYPVLMVILAHFLLKEKIKRKDYLGIALVLVGVVLISIA